MNTSSQNTMGRNQWGKNSTFAQSNSSRQVTMASSRSNSYGSVNKSSKKIHYNYTVTLRLEPVELGLKCHSAPWYPRKFIGINAFNYYFDYLLPEVDGFSLPDVWAGYFHITLGKFCLERKPDSELEKKENSLVHYIENNTANERDFATIFPCKFRTEGLDVHSGDKRFDEAMGIDFVTLKVADLDNTLDKLFSVLKIIREGVETVGGDWEKKSFEDYRKQLHVTVRKYEQMKETWSTKFIEDCGVDHHVKDNPVEFECTALDIAQTRRQAIDRDQQHWWIGVTSIPLSCIVCHEYFPKNSPGVCRICRRKGNDHRCSGCGRQENKQMSWPGYCRTCKNYERLKPLWSTKP
jgi:hypothetical protein